MDSSPRYAGIGALADGTRRALHEYVVAQPDPVGHEQAAAALGIAQHNVHVHLDRPVAEELCRRADREFAWSLPPSRYDPMGDILAAGLNRAAGGVPLDEALHEVAVREGRNVDGAASGVNLAHPLAALAPVLASEGYEPQLQADMVVLSNCPFDTLAKERTDLVCGRDRDFVHGVAEGLGCDQEPEPDLCCVKARLEGT